MTSPFQEKITKVYNALTNKINSSINTHNSSSSSHQDLRNSKISYGQVDNTSTSTVFTATVPNLNELVDGTAVMLRNGVVSSASGFTLNVNNLGAKPVYNSMTDATRDTTIFNIAYTMLFVYDSSRISGGCWICYRGYDGNTIGHQLRTNSTKYIATDKGYKYRIWLQTSEDGKFMPVNTSTSTNATANRSSAMNTREFIIGGDIRYYGTDGITNQNAEMTATTMWQQYVFALGYSFNNTGSALSLTIGKPVYMVATPTSNGKARLTSPYYTQDLPNSEDGKIYILLGYMYSATNIELTLDHPVFEYRNGGVGLYNPSYTISEVDTLLNGKANSNHNHDGTYLTEHNPIDASLSSTSTNAVQNKAVYNVKSQLDGLGDAFSSNMETIYNNLSNKIDTAGTGLSKSGTTLNHSNSITAQTSAVFKKISYDGQGHITGTANVTASDIPTLTKSKISDFSHTHTKSQITDFPTLSTVATTGDYDDLTDKPTIPSASSSTPSADTTNGSYGSGTDYARANHTHPKSSLYAESSHSHIKEDINFQTTTSSFNINLYADQYMTDRNNFEIPTNEQLTLDFTDLLEYDYQDYVSFEIIGTGGALYSVYIFDLKGDNLYTLDSSYPIKILKITGGYEVSVYDSGDIPTSYEVISPIIYINNLSNAVITGYFSNKTYSRKATWLDMIYPIGSIYISTLNRNPSLYFGGTWEQIENRFLLASGTNYNIGATGGEASVTLTANQSGIRAHGHGMAHTHNHRHQVGGKEWSTSSGNDSARITTSNRTAGYKYTDYNDQASSKSTTDNNTASNASEAHNNMPPYLVVSVWERTA